LRTFAVGPVRSDVLTARNNSITLSSFHFTCTAVRVVVML
jgi:hypothetical protein